MYILHCVFTAYLPLTDVKPRLGESPDCSGETFTFELGLSDASACLYLAPVLEYEPLETDTEPDSALVPGPALSLSRCLTCEFVLWPLPGVERKGEHTGPALEDSPCRRWQSWWRESPSKWQMGLRSLCWSFPLSTAGKAPGGAAFPRAPRIAQPGRFPLPKSDVPGSVPPSLPALCSVAR